MIPSNISDAWNRLKALWRMPLYRNAIYLILNIGLTSLIGFFFWLIVARIYSDVEVGYSSAIISAIGLLSMLSLVGFNSWIVRYLPSSDEPNNVVNTAFTFSGIIAAIAAIIFLVGIQLWAPDLSFINKNFEFILVFVIVAILSVLSLLSNNVFIANRESLYTLIKDVGASIIKIGLALAFAMYFRSFGIVFSWGIALGIGVTVAIVFFLPRLQQGYRPAIMVKKTLLTNTWKYFGASYIYGLFTGAAGQIFPLMVLALTTVQTNAHFYIAWMIANLLFAIPMSVSHALFAEMARFPDSAAIKINLFRSLRFVYILLIPLLVLLLAISSWLLGAFGPGYVDDGLDLLRILALSSVFMAFSQAYYSILQAQDKLKEMLLFRVLSTIATLLISYFILKATGIIGIGYVFAGVQFIVAVIALARLLIWLRRLSRG